MVDEVRDVVKHSVEERKRGDWSSMKVIWQATRPEGKNLQVLIAEDGKILLKAQQGNSRLFYQLSYEEVSGLVFSLAKVLLK